MTPRITCHGATGTVTGSRDWLAASKLSPRRVFVTHGEPSAADALRRRLVDELGWSVMVPSLGDTQVLE